MTRKNAEDSDGPATSNDFDALGELGFVVSDNNTALERALALVQPIDHLEFSLVTASSV
jgi:hypothetical protein